MNIEDAKKVARDIIAKGAKDELIIFADLMADFGDIRHNVVRKHATCCDRGINIAEHFCREIIADIQQAIRTHTPSELSLSWELMDSWPCYINDL